MKLLSPCIVSISVLIATGCGASAPTPELVDARRAYDQARSSEAATYSPDKLLSAKQALDRAEAANQNSAGLFEENSLAYIAKRRAELATVYGTYEKERRDLEQAKVDYSKRQEQLRHAADAQTDAANRSLEKTTDSLVAARKEVATEKADSQVKLASEKDARAKAEQTAAAALASLAKIAQVKEEARGVVITLDGSVLFVTGKAELLPIARTKLDEVAKALKDMDDDKSAQVEGYTDSRGADDANQKLSQARADAVREHLVGQGVKPDKIRAVGKGEMNPVASNESPEGRANNRRVEIVIQGKGSVR
jgi:outer membrane protein OmpA-like peptidoglycan-associated protein